MARSISKSVGRGGVNRRPDVLTVQKLINANLGKLTPLAPLEEDGLNGPKTIGAITEFQRRVVRMSKPDGRVDPGGKTLRTLNQGAPASSEPEVEPTPPANVSGFANALAKFAEGEVGVMEASKNNTGADLEKYKKATWLKPGAWAWCAAFVCWCYQEALKTRPVSGVKRPRTAGAWDFERWAREQKGVKLIKPAGTVKRGDIVVFTFSHIGIAVGSEKNGIVPTVEGNTNTKGTRDGGGRTRDGVYKKSRSKKLIRSVIRTTG